MEYDRIDTDAIKGSLDCRVIAESFGLEAKQSKSTARYSAGPCIKCGGDDRFYATKEFWACRVCHPEHSDVIGLVQWVYNIQFIEAIEILTGKKEQSSLPAPISIIPPEQIESRKNERLAQQERAQKNALSIIQGKDTLYNDTLFDSKSELVDKAWAFIEAQYPGLYPETLDQFKIGYAQQCPTSPYSDSITIPSYWGINGSTRLVGLRHRLLSPNGQGKYRPEAKNLPTVIHNASVLLEEQPMVFIVEGAMKDIRLNQEGFTAVGIPGANSFKEKWGRLFSNVETTYIALDPDVNEDIITGIYEAIRPYSTPKIMNLPFKADEFFQYGDAVDFIQFINLAR